MSDGSWNIDSVGTVIQSRLPERIQNLAESLSRIHGRVAVSKEASGFHIYMASPYQLALDGVRELNKRHLSVNADRFLGLGDWTEKIGSYDPDRSALCMKSDTPYTVSELLTMAPLSERGIQDAPTGVLTMSTERYLVPDGKGNMIPEGPGTLIPLTQLPPSHPAAAYLLERRFDLGSLERQFRAGFCEEELPIDPSIKRFYRRLPLGLRDTPQGRIIFFCDIEGVQQGWQARVIDKTIGEPPDMERWMLNPYTRQWMLIERWDPVRAKLAPIPEIAMSPVDWELSKYKTGRGALRNELLMGVDAALEWNRINRPGRPALAILVEGPLDAGRTGPPGVAMLGKFLSAAQADILCRLFQKIIFVPDSDVAGRKSLKRVGDLLSGRVEFDFLEAPRGFKDLGALHSMAAAWELLLPLI